MIVDLDLLVSMIRGLCVRFEMGSLVRKLFEFHAKELLCFPSIICKDYSLLNDDFLQSWIEEDISVLGEDISKLSIEALLVVTSDVGGFNSGRWVFFVEEFYIQMNEVAPVLTVGFLGFSVLMGGDMADVTEVLGSWRRFSLLAAKEVIGTFPDCFTAKGVCFISFLRDLDVFGMSSLIGKSTSFVLLFFSVGRTMILSSRENSGAGSFGEEVFITFQGYLGFSEVLGVDPVDLRASLSLRELFLGFKNCWRNLVESELNNSGGGDVHIFEDDCDNGLFIYSGELIFLIFLGQLVLRYLLGRVLF